MLTAAPTAEEARERPFVFGAQELIPAVDQIFLKTEQLATFFQVYNSALDSAGKPNLVMEYNFHRKEGGAEKFFNNLAKYGNTSAGSIPLVLDEAVQGGRIKRGDSLVMCGFGAGLSWGTGVFRW